VIITNLLIESINKQFISYGFLKKYSIG